MKNKIINDFNSNSINENYNKPQILLKLIIENSISLQKGTVIFITQNGMENSQRSPEFKDKNIYFGYKTKKSLINDIDFYLPENESLKNSLESNSNFNSKSFDNEGKFFKIFYNEESKKFYIQDLGFGFGTFIRLTDEFILKDNSLISIGDSYLVFSYSFPNENNSNNSSNNIFNNENSNNNNNILYLKPYSGSVKYQPVQLSIDNNNNNNNNCFSVGRSENCFCCLNDKMLSRVHCVIYFSKEKGWFIKDGNENGTPSTNGTWIYALEEMEIKDNMTFKANSNLFSCHLGMWKNN